MVRYLLSSLSQLGHAMLGGGDPGLVTLQPGHPNPVQPVRQQRKTPGAHSPDYASARRCRSYNQPLNWDDMGHGQPILVLHPGSVSDLNP